MVKMLLFKNWAKPITLIGSIGSKRTMVSRTDFGLGCKLSIPICVVYICLARGFCCK